MPGLDNPANRLATRLLFLVAGFGYACWAPLVPVTRTRLAIDEHVLGLLILCIGAGSILAMVGSGMLAGRIGSKPIMVGSSLGFATALAALPFADSIYLMAVALFAFGATLGALDVAMNLHAVEVEKAAGQPLMSGFHALFSIGGFLGAACMTFLLARGWAATTSTLACAVPMTLAVLLAALRIEGSKGAREGPLFALPRGLVLVIAVLACITFLVEGALLDWSALLLVDAALVPASQGGLGYMAFSVAMTAGRLGGDRIAARFGDRRTLLWGGIVALAGFVLLLIANGAAAAMAGFVLIGLGCSNIVPVLFRRAAAQTAMPSSLAVASITTTAYAGILAGPAGIGFVAGGIGLEAAFWILAALLAVVPLCAGAVTERR